MRLAEGFLISLAKTMLAALLLICLFSLVSWIWFDEGGIIILPFETGDEGYSGQALADLLTHDLLRIKQIHEAEKDLPHPLPIGNYSVPEITPQGFSIDYSISNVGMLGQGPVSLSLGQLLLTLKRLAPWSRPSPTLSCSLQRYGSRVLAVALFDDGRGIEAWEAIYEGNFSGGTPQLIQDLAFKVYHGLCMRESRLDVRQTEVKLARDWRAFLSITQAMEARQAYLAAGDLDQLNLSREKAREAKALEPGYMGSSEVLSDLGYEYVVLGWYDEAMIIFEEIAEDKPASSAFGRGLIYSSRGNDSAALAAYDEAIRINPGYALAWNNKGVTLSDLGRKDEAIIAYDQALKINPGYALAWFNKGVALSDLGRKDEAIVAYDQALKINPGYALAWFNKGVALSDLGRKDEAIVAYDQALKIDPGFALAWNNKGVTLSDLGRKDEAIVAYDRALKINPGYALAWFNKGVALSDLGRKDEAIVAYDRALKINPGYANAWTNKGVALSDLGRKDEAIVAYDRALKINPGYALAWFNKGVALSALGRKDEALAAYERALDLSPHDPNTLGNYAGLLLALGNESGFAPLEEALQLSENETAYRPLRLECFFYLYAHSPDPGQRDEALSEIKALMEEGVRSPGWDLTANVKAARDHPDPALLEALARVISGEGELSELEAIPAWRAAGA